MDLFFIIEMLVLLLLLAALIVWVRKKMANDKIYGGAGFGEPIDPRELTEKELECYRQCADEIYGKLYADACELGQNYGSGEDILERQAMVSVVSGGRGIYGYPCKFLISGKEYTLPRNMFYYLQDGRMPQGLPAVAIWEELDGKWYFRLAIPEVYLK